METRTILMGTLPTSIGEGQKGPGTGPGNDWPDLTAGICLASFVNAAWFARITTGSAALPAGALSFKLWGTVLPPGVTTPTMGDLLLIQTMVIPTTGQLPNTTQLYMLQSDGGGGGGNFIDQLPELMYWSYVNTAGSGITLAGGTVFAYGYIG